MRKPWTAQRNSSNGPSNAEVRSCTHQGAGKKASEAWRPMPSSMAKPRRASRSYRRRSTEGNGDKGSSTKVKESTRTVRAPEDRR